MANDEKLYAPYLALFKVCAVHCSCCRWLVGVADTVVYYTEQIGGGAAAIER